MTSYLYRAPNVCSTNHNRRCIMWIYFRISNRILYKPRVFRNAFYVIIDSCSPIHSQYGRLIPVEYISILYGHTHEQWCLYGPISRNKLLWEDIYISDVTDLPITEIAAAFTLHCLYCNEQITAIQIFCCAVVSHSISRFSLLSPVINMMI